MALEWVALYCGLVLMHIWFLAVWTERDFGPSFVGAVVNSLAIMLVLWALMRLIKGMSCLM